MTVEQIQQLLMLIQTLMLLAPVAALIWKMAGTNARINMNSKDLDGIGAKLNKVIEEIKQEQSDYSKQLNLISTSMAEILSTLHYLKEDLKTVKQDIKELHKKIYDKNI